MLRNYLKVAVRTLWKNKEFSFINVVGLALGISTCLLITLYVLDELGYDKFNENAARVYRLTPILHTSKGDNHRAVTSPVMAPTLQANFPEIEKTVRVGGSSRILAYQDKKFYDTQIFYADSTLFDIFTFPLVTGDAKTALVNPYSIVLTERAAKKYFGDEEPIGKIMTFSDTMTLSVTGVMKNIPMNSHLQFDVLLSRSTIWEMTNHQVENEWFNNNIYTYILLQPGSDPKALEAKFPAFLEKQMAQEKKESGLWYDFKLQPITDIHLKSDLSAEFGPNGSIKYVYIFSVIAVLVLLIACANYINLSTAKSMNRAKELGMRKVIGARRQQLMAQLLGESFLLTTLSSIVAATIITSALPAFNLLTAKNLNFQYLLQPEMVAIFIGIFIAISFLAGAYPALLMSSYSPIKTLKSNIRHGRENGLLRKGLVVFQFTISIILIASTILIFRQLDFLQNQNLGLDKEKMVELKMRNTVTPKAQLIRDEMARLPGVLSASATSFSYADNLSSIAVAAEGPHEKEVSSEPVISVDYDFLKTFKIEMAAGRDFSREFPSDEAEAFIVNETAVKHFNWGTPEEAIGKRLDWGLGKKGKVIGVVKDFNFSSLHQSIRPLVIHVFPEWYDFIALKISPDQVSQTIGQLEATWKKLDLDSPFDYSFMDKDFEKLYKAEQQTRTIIGLLSSLAIFIACLGLFGLAAFMAEQRTKEIGVRKVLGANIMSIVSLLSGDFLKLVVVAIALAVPVAWFAMNQWLGGFAYKIEVSWWIFAMAGGAAVLIALLTVSFQSIKAALTNPVDSLRSE